MAYFHVTDPTIDATHPASYAEYIAATPKHSGSRTLEAEEIKVW